MPREVRYHPAKRQNEVGMHTLTRAASVFLALALATCDGGGSPAGDGSTTGDGALTEAGSPPGDGSTSGESVAGTAKVGEPCTKDSDCAEPPNAECFTTVGGGFAPTIVFPGGYCSKGCGQEDSGTPDCGAEGACAQLSMSGSGGASMMMSFCAKACKKHEDCRASEGYTCRIIFPGFPGFCAPL